MIDPVSLAIMAAAAGVKGLVGLGKTISGAVQKNRANKELEKEMPRYSRPAEYEKLLGIYQKQAGMGELPGQSRYESALSTRTARGVRATSKMADTGVAGVQAAMGLYGQEQQAVRDLGLSFADYQQKAQQNLAGAYQVGMQEHGKEFSYNQWYPAQVKKNIAAQKFNAGQQNLWGGIDMMAGAGMDFAGNYIAAGMGGGNGGGGGGATATGPTLNAQPIGPTPFNPYTSNPSDMFLPSLFRR